MKIVERWYNFLGYHIHIRVEPDEFKKTLRRLSDLLDDGDDEVFKKEIDLAYRKYGYDAELIRISTLYQFLNDELSSKN